MKRKREAEARRKGFTIIEVSLVLAVSGLLLVGIISGVSGSVARQRYNDSVQSVVDDIRALYTAANNPQGTSDSGGNSDDQAIYGIIALFGYGVARSTTGSTPIYSGTLVGDAEVTSAAKTGATLADFTKIEPKIIKDSISSTTPPWDAQIQDVDGSLKVGVLLIIHSPNGGAVHSYFIPGAKSGAGTSIQLKCNPYRYINQGELFEKPSIDSLLNKLNTCTVTSDQDINLCIDSPDLYAAGGIRRNIRILADARNSSAVELVDVNSEDNQCGSA